MRNRLVVILGLLLGSHSFAQVIPGGGAVASGPSSSIIGNLQTATGGTLKNGTLSFTPSQPAVVSGSSSIAASTTSCYTSNQGNIVGVPDPLVAPVVSEGLAGTLPTGTYYIKIAYAGAGGVSVASPESVQVIDTVGGGAIIVNPPALQPPSATGFFNVYVGTISGSETLQAVATGWTQAIVSNPLGNGSPAPTSNSSTCDLYFSDQLVPTGTFYTVGLVNRNGSQIAGFPQTWCTYGGAGATINVSNGAPTGNCGTNGVFYPTPIYANPQNGAAQSISSPFSFLGSVAFLGNDTFSGNNTFTGQNSATIYNLDNVLYVDGLKYPTIQAALAAGGAGVTVVVPTSMTVTTGSILMSAANQTIRCAPGVVITRGFNSDLINITGSEATVDGCILDGNNPTNTGNSVIICQAQRCRITNNTVRNGSNIGIYVAKSSGQIPGAIVQNNRVYSNLGTGIFGEKGASDALITNNIVDTTGATVSGVHAIALHSTTAGQNVSHSTISNNILYNGGTNGFCVEIGAFLGDTPDSNTIENNTCKATATNIAGGYSLGITTHPIVSGNTFDNNAQVFLLANFIAGIEVVGGSTDCSISGNTLVLGAPAGGQGLSLDRISRCTVSGNSINGWGPFSATSAGIKLGTVVASSNLNDNLVLGNVLTCPGSGTCAGVWVQCNNGSANCNRNHITSNHVFGNAVAGSFCYKTELDAGTMTSTAVANNSGDSCDTGLSATGAQTLTYDSNNVFSNASTKFTSNVTNTVSPQWKRGVTGCTTAAGAAGGACTTVVTWPIPYPDTNYTATCLGNGVGAGVPVMGGITAKGAASVTFQTIEDTAVNAQFFNIECSAKHDADAQ